jgi:arylsulfatase A-like enzyme|uniref:sulfatase-like hydrolase/transferase n=1 Tax=Flavobacterium sp. TaxID=239 RepID=UPI0040487288
MTNFVFIVADDLGYADLGCYGGRSNCSPNLDKLATNGVRYINGYSNSPVCSPTRFALMTARYQYWIRGASEEPMAGAAVGNPELGLFPNLPTLPSMLRDLGFHTALIGKWHLGFRPHFGPEKSGYMHHFGPMSGGVGYYSHAARKPESDLELDGKPYDEPGYLTDLISRRAAQYVRDRATDKKPFLLSLHYTAPHWPWETRAQGKIDPEISRDISHLDGGNVETYQTMIREMDEGIGWVIDALKETGQLDDTVIVFTSDNGGERFSDNWPLVGGKMDLTEGGIRVPYIVHWPKGINNPGRVSTQHCLTMDWTATILAIAGATPPAGHKLDGISLVSTFKNADATLERPMFWRMKYNEQRAFRLGDWKYLKINEHEYLFNIARDARERANQAKREPDRLNAMRAQFEAWNAQIPPVPVDAKVSLIGTLADMPAR